MTRPAKRERRTKALEQALGRNGQPAPRGLAQRLDAIEDKQADLEERIEALEEA